MEISMILAAGRDGSIGKDGDLIWHISEDLKRFKRLTTGNKVIMGRKTWESLPKRPLPGRENIVVTRNPDYEAPGARVISGLEDFLRKIPEDEEVFVIGGGEIYRQALPFAHTIYLTLVEEDCPEADTFLHIDPEEWELKEEEGPFTTKEGVSYRFQLLRRRQTS